jgi:hypothetical protein
MINEVVRPDGTALIRKTAWSGVYSREEEIFVVNRSGKNSMPIEKIPMVRSTANRSGIVRLCSAHASLHSG